MSLDLTEKQKERSRALDRATRMMAVFAVLYMLAVFVGALYLPEWIAWENGPIEMTQNVVLFLGIIQCIIYYRSDRSSTVFDPRMWLAGVGAFALMLGRELSWGRVLFPVAIGWHGPRYLPMYKVPYHTAIHAVIGCLCALLLLALIRWVPWKKIFTQIPFPKMVVCMLFFAVLCSHMGDKGDFMFLGEDGEGEIIEEGAELLMYMLFIYLARYYHEWCGILSDSGTERDKEKIGA